MASVIRPELQAAAQALKAADGLLITTGAGMGVDSGLPDFRGSSGFWKSYPALKASGLRFQDIANPYGQKIRNTCAQCSTHATMV